MIIVNMFRLLNSDRVDAADDADDADVDDMLVMIAAEAAFKLILRSQVLLVSTDTSVRSSFLLLLMILAKVIDEGPLKIFSCLSMMIQKSVVDGVDNGDDNFTNDEGDDKDRIREP